MTGTRGDAALLEAYGVLSGCERDYPGFRDWFWLRVAPGLGDTRRIFTERRQGRIAGIAIAKREAGERKLCTLWVDPEFRSQGLGAALMRRAMEWMETDRPLVTAPERRLAEVAPLFSGFGFARVQTLDSRYRAGHKEAVFNRDFGA